LDPFSNRLNNWRDQAETAAQSIEAIGLGRRDMGWEYDELFDTSSSFLMLAFDLNAGDMLHVSNGITGAESFSAVLAKTRKKLEEAANTIDLAQTRTNVMTRKLKGVEALPLAQSAALLPGLAADADLEPEAAEDG